jgi:hypothetical protein
VGAKPFQVEEERVEKYLPLKIIRRGKKLS